MSGCAGDIGAWLNQPGSKSNINFATSLDWGGNLYEYRAGPYWGDIVIDRNLITGAIMGCHDSFGTIGATISQGAIHHYAVAGRSLGKSIVMHGYGTGGSKYVSGPFGTSGYTKYGIERIWVTCCKGL